MYLNIALVRSNTHGSFARSKTIEEGSEEWWASEKAKKLSPKKFDASEIKFKKVFIYIFIFIKAKIFCLCVLI